LLAAYALSSQVGFIGAGSGFNKDDWFANFGPLATERRHVMNISGIVDLPKRFQISFISSYVSAPPFTACLANLDLNGDGTIGDVLPGSRADQFCRNLGKSDLVRQVDQFNESFAGGKTARGQAITRVTLPSKFDLGDSYITQDLRASRPFAIREPARLTVFGEVFNLLNFANLSGQSGDLMQTSNFGHPNLFATDPYFLAPPLGILGAAEVFLLARQGRRPYCAKLYHQNDKRCIFCHSGRDPAAATRGEHYT
jgi:hypothetical protein